MKIKLESKYEIEPYKYALVVVDDHDKKVDAVPLRERTQEALIKGFKELYDHGILKMPKVRLEVDKGDEFTDLHNDPYFDKVHNRR